MKLSKLNGAVRRAEDKIAISICAADGRPVTFKVPKSLIVASLTEAFPEGGTFETGFELTAENRLRIAPTEGESPIMSDAEADETYFDESPSDDLLSDDDDDGVLVDDEPDLLLDED